MDKQKSKMHAAAQHKSQGSAQDSARGTMHNAADSHASSGAESGANAAVQQWLLQWQKHSAHQLRTPEAVQAMLTLARHIQPPYDAAAPETHAAPTQAAGGMPPYGSEPFLSLWMQSIASNAATGSGGGSAAGQSAHSSQPSGDAWLAMVQLATGLADRLNRCEQRINGLESELSGLRQHLCGKPEPTPGAE